MTCAVTRAGSASGVAFTGTEGRNEGDIKPAGEKDMQPPQEGQEHSIGLPLLSLQQSIFSPSDFMEWGQ